MQKGPSEFFGKEFGVPASEVKAAVKAAYDEYNAHTAAIRAEGERALKYAEDNGRRVIVMAGRPYHIDPEINHGIDRLISSFGLVIVSEDSVAHLAQAGKGEGAQPVDISRAALRGGKVCDHAA